MKKIIFTLAAFAFMTTACTTKQQTTGIDLANLDTTAVPQNDFYQFACGGWMAANPLTPEYSRFGSFAEKETLTRRLSSEALRDYLHKAFVTTVRPDDSVGSSALVRKFKAWRNQSSHKEK